MTTDNQRIHNLLNPTSIAIVGASERSAWSSAFIRNLKRWNFPGQIHLVNPRTPEVLGQATAPTVDSIDGLVDHALIAVPASLTPDVLADCDRAGVRSVTAIASGFSEAGPEGKALAAEVTQFCADHGISMIGPNCYGFINFTTTTMLSRNWLDAMPPGGGISLVSQSGQLGLSLTGSAFARGVDLRYLISSGNELVVSSTDYFDYFVDDPGTTVLGGVLERIADPALFQEVATRALEVGKPIVVCKMGRSAIGQKVAEAHTASVVGNAVVVETFLRDLGVIVVDTVDELIETAGVLASRAAPSGPRTMFVGGSGGAGGYFADQADGSPIELAPISDTLRSQLAEVSGLDPHTIGNPMDMTAGGASALTRIVGAVAKAAEFDVLVVQGEQPRSREVHGDAYIERVAGNMKALAAAGRAGQWACFQATGDRDPSELGKDMAREHDVRYVHGSPGVKALGNAIDYGTNRATRLAAAKKRLAAHQAGVRPGRAELLRSLGPEPTESDVKRLLQAYGMPTLRERFCETADAAATAAKEIGFPVVMKISSTDIAHKTDVGGVLLDLRDEAAVRDGFASMMTVVAAKAPHAHLAGVVVSPFVSHGVEVLLGVVIDPSLGPVVVTGAGGIYVEQFGDATAALPPFDAARSLEMLRELRIWKLLEGVRGAERGDIEALAEAMARFSELVGDLAGSLVALEINPLVVRPGDGGVVALDGMIELADRSALP
ncbi:hypothetical protein Aple_075220 [Acrocarpospora pleiomorpha]|uniref:ATP-grasp domain-containing protein n=1 Tax=Acrocarpospora pleiomorpha TaxID=90975 RepID=A0A5M3XYU6_9ACTN|nr:acetate--CoA ligase family protein [Acrocarpospora pleiomorpha]GES24623.1 hypothetical protein Aple_075220 [Acrocarpospora pleiomorpha]